MRLRFIMGEVWNGLRRNSTMALSVALVTFVSLTFVGAAALTQMQVQQLKEAWYGQVEVSIFLCPPGALDDNCAEGAVTTAQQDEIVAVLEEGNVADLVQSEGEMPDSEADFLAALSESRFRDLAAGRSLIGPHRSDLYGVYAAKGVPARDCSTGEQKALLVSLILANARALAGETGDAPILLLDEVAAHLDPGRRAALFDEICALGAQAWMTGTEVDLFAELGPRAQYLAVSDQDGCSSVSDLAYSG